MMVHRRNPQRLARLIGGVCDVNARYVAPALLADMPEAVKNTTAQ
jgi:hypothetical protein